MACYRFVSSLEVFLASPEVLSSCDRNPETKSAIDRHFSGVRPEAWIELDGGVSWASPTQ
jgi:hypothetical protein